MFKSGALLTLGNMISAVTLMVRNIIVARLISVEDMGVASTFAITMALLEMITDFALNQMLVQDRDGEKPRMKATLQLLQFLRGLIAGVVMFFLAGVYARLMNVPDIAWTFQLLALVPVLRGLAHLDIFQLQRGLNYKPYVLTIVVPQIASVLALWPLSQIFGDYRIMLYALLVQHTLYLVISHLTAKSRFAFAWEAPVFWRAFHFGWPLFLNGILMFVILNGDRVIVANVMGMTELGLFAVAYTITLSPVLLLAKTMQFFFLPQLSARQDDEGRFARMGAALLESYCCLVGLFAVGVVVAGPPLFILLFGEKYLEAQIIFVWLGLVQAVRLAKAGPSVVSMSRARTKNAMIANLVRILSLPVAFVLLGQTGNILVLAWAALVAELLSLGVALWLMRREARMSLRPVWPAFAALLVLGLVLVIDVIRTGPRPDILAHAHPFQLVILLALAAVFAFSPNMRRMVLARMRDPDAA